MVFSKEFRDNIFLNLSLTASPGSSLLHHYGAGTNVGNVRDNNEDSYVCDEEKELWIVADGMGGLGFGEVASAITTYTVATLVREGHGINQAIELAHKNIKEYAESDGLGTNMGTTIVLLLSHGSLYNVFWVGDSRAYLLDSRNMRQITVDHSLVQSLIDQGEITKEQATTDPRKNAVTRALGVQEIETVRADSISERWQPNQKILLCSDGLTDCVSDEVIESIMRGDGTDQEIVDRLIQAALDGGGNDNITVIVVSAPATAKSGGDSDTHVPDDSESRGSTGDDTFIPSLDDDTQSRQGSNEDKSIQLSLDLKQPSLPSNEVIRFETRQPLIAPIRNFWPGGIAAAIMCIALLASVDSKETDAASISQHFTVAEWSATDRVARDLPELNFEDFTQHFTKEGQSLQVGLFSRLQGAESRQQQLVQLGLLPHIEKRIEGGITRYAVIVGPLSENAYSSALTRLQAHGIGYFHRSEAG